MEKSNVPIVLDLGKVKDKRVKQLKRGRGKLLAEVHEAIDQVRSSLGPEAESKEIVPVVLVYRKKPKKSGYKWMW